MEEVLILLSNDLMKVCLCLLVLGIAYGSNIVLSMYFNTKIGNESFDKRRFYQGVLKLLILIVGTASLVIAIDLAIYVFGIDGTETGDVITIVAIIGTIGVATFKYIKQAYEKLISIINYQGSNKWCKIF